jgi:hypothetical protein
VTWRASWRLVVLIAITALGVAAAGATVGHSTSTGAAAKSTTFRDAAGEDPAGPDIGTVVVSNDDEGTLTFRVEIPSHPNLTEDMRVRVWLDSDAKSNTGLEVDGLRGADNFLLVDRGELGFGEVGLFTCSVSTCGGGSPALPSGSPTSLRFAYRDGATFVVDATDLGVERLQRLRFWIEAWTGIGFDPITHRWDFTDARPDFAPDGAGRRLGYPNAQGESSWIHESRTMLVKSFSVQPGNPRAGRPFTLRLALIRTDTGAPLTSGTVSCSSRVAGKPLRPRSSAFVGGRARCVFSIPANARGRAFRSTISVRFAGATLGRTISGRVS